MLRLFKLGVITFLLSVMVGVCASAYTTTQDGLSTVYTWGWSDDFTVRSMGVAGNAYIRASYNNNTVYQNPGMVNGTRLGTYIEARGLANNLQYDAGAHTYASENGSYKYLHKDGEYPCAIFSFHASDYISGYINTNALELDSDFGVSFEYLAYFEDRENGTSNYILQQIKETPLVLYERATGAYNILPTVVTTEDVYDSSSGTFKLIKITYVIDLKVSEGLTVVIDGFSTQFYSCYDLPYMASGVYQIPFFTRYNMSFSDVEFRTIPSEEAQEALLIANVSNDDLITKLGVINEIDQGKINYQKVEYNKVSSATGQLSGMTEFSESLSSQVDLSQRVDILEEGTLVDGVSNMWDLFPWESDFFTIALGMIASISLLSLILHGGERAIFNSSGKGKSSKNNKGGDD